MNGAAHPSTFAALSFPDSKKEPLYCWVDRESFQSSDGVSQVRTHDLSATFLTLTERL